jgi:succinate dehydrogenase / fumarate reductase, cytochrome b subunit
MVSRFGALWLGYLVLHLAGNLTLFADADGSAFRHYAENIHGYGVLVKVAEGALLALFVVHIALGLRAALENREARPVRYKELVPKGRRTWSSVTMVASGAVVLVFTVIHVLDFRMAVGVVDSPEAAELARLVVARLSSPTGAGIYLVGMLFLGFHLSHGFQSLFQSLGLRHPAYSSCIRALGLTLAIVIAGGFAGFPILYLMFEGQWPWSS